MADNDKRLLELPDINYSDDLYFMTEKSGSVTSKIQADKVKLKVDTSLATAGKAADAKATGDAINAEAAARQQAISSEVTDRNSAISAAIGTEVTNRNAAIAVETENRQAAYQDLDNRKAEIDGYYDELSVGNADQLIPSAMETERVPYNFRTSGGSLDIGDREFDKLVGLSLPWNQLVQNGNFENTNNWSGAGYGTLSASDNILSLTISETGGSARIEQSVTLIKGHKYLARATMKVPYSANLCVTFYGTGSGSYVAMKGVTADTWNEVIGIKEANDNDVSTEKLRLYVGSTSVQIGDVAQFKNVSIIDLTQLFGSQIAEYIYSLEQATAGVGVAWFKKFFSKQYYAQNSGKIESVNVSSHDMVGFNQWDEEWEVGAFNVTTGANTQDFGDQIRSKNLIPVLPNTQYYLSFPVTSGVGAWAMFYDENKNICTDLTGVATSSVSGNSVMLGNISFTTPKNASYMKFYMTRNYGGTYKHDICIHLKWDDSRNGEYEPYKKNSYALDPIELRGILKLDSNNEPYADGDTYEADGTVTRRYAELDLGADLSWTYHSEGQFFYANALSGVPENTPAVRNIGYPTACSKYASAYDGAIHVYTAIVDKTVTFNSSALSSGRTILIKDSSAGTDASAFKTAMTGVKLVYPLATPTTESADPYTDPQTVDNWGTEQYVDKAYTDGDRDVEIPVGHETKYPANLRDKLETSPNAPTSDGDYIVHCESGQLSYVALGSTTTIQNIIARLNELEGGGE